jgi:Clp amino terminal domain, pathogenicity island component
MYPFERFSEDAKRTLTLAQEEAERSHLSYIGTEHLLLGLLRVEKGTAYRVLTDLGIDIGTVRNVIRSVVGRNERILVQSIIPTSRVKKVIELSFEEARRMGDNYVDTGHILLGLIIEGEGIAAHVLEDLGATFKKVRPAVEAALAQPPSEHVTPNSPTGRPYGFGVLHRMAPGRGESDAARFADLLNTPAIAKLLKAKGVDTDALSKQLAEPPAQVSDLRAKVIVANHALGAAVDSQDFEVATKLRDELNDLAERLAKAEQEWLDSLA